jgi:hypothetical protein
MRHATELLSAQLLGAHQLFAATIGGLTVAQAHCDAGGHTVPIAAHLGHVIIFEDMAINAMLKRGAPLFTTVKTGFSDMPPQQPPWDAWGRAVKVDLDQAMAYAGQVAESAATYVTSLDDAALAAPFDLTALGQGMQTVGVLLSVLLLNLHVHTGEISCLKGLQRLKGYPI